jgi:cytidylate kinase
LVEGARLVVNLEGLRYSGSVCISGLTASGKSTHSHLLAGEFGLTYVSGSQIQLNFMGVSPIQTKDFWITDQAKAFWDEDQFNRIDSELLRLEQLGDGYIFDTSTMPWRHQRPALCIWLESTLDSRVLKSIVSHRGRGEFPIEEYRERIAEKDRSTIELYRKLYGLDIGGDLSCFDIILDISSLITEASLDASLASIRSAHQIVRLAAGAYLTQRSDFFAAFQDAAHENRRFIKRNLLKPTQR